MTKTIYFAMFFEPIFFRFHLPMKQTFLKSSKTIIFKWFLMDLCILSDKKSDPTYRGNKCFLILETIIFKRFLVVFVDENEKKTIGFCVSLAMRSESSVKQMVFHPIFAHFLSCKHLEKPLENHLFGRKHASLHK